MIDRLDGYPQFYKKKWAFLSVEDIQSQMRKVLTNTKETEEKVKNGLDLVCKNFSYNKVGNMFKEMLGSIWPN